MHAEVQAFLRCSRYLERGAVITDLDGTAVHEREGRACIPPDVERGLKRIHDSGRQVVINTLRFPRSVIGVFGDEWHRSTGTDLPLVSMKGSQIGRVVRDESGAMCFEEWHAETLTPAEIREVMVGVEGMVDDGVRDLLVFHYPRDWRQGELIWTPDADRVEAVAAKYRSATRAFSSDVRAFGDTLLSQEMCMIFLLIDLPEDRRMAYQHTQRASFFTRAGVNKRTGAEAMARHLGIDLAASIGAGDAPPDDFLAAVGFAIIVGDNGEVDYRGLAHTARVPDIASFGHLLAVTGESLA